MATLAPLIDRVCRIESLDTRRLLAESFRDGEMVLRLFMNEADERLVFVLNGRTVHSMLDGQDAHSFNLSRFKTINVQCAGGDDYVDGSAINVQLQMRGFGGNDTLIGGSRNDDFIGYSG